MIDSIQAEKERRLKEKNQANTKRFMDERKNTAMKQNKRREKQKKLHETQLQDISTFVKSVSITIDVTELEADRTTSMPKSVLRLFSG